MQIESFTDVGLHRKNNEDRFLVNILDDQNALLVIADGMGGHAAGEVAAELAVSSFEGFSFVGAENILAELVDRIKKAGKAVRERERADPACSGMGTTLSALLIAGQWAYWAHLGDTRIYRYRQGALLRITEDHTLAGMLLKKGEITGEEARVHPYGSVLTRCVGCDEHQPDSGVFDLTEGDQVLLSTDGLHDLIPESRIAELISADVTLKEKLAALLAACLEAGGRDNITGIIASI
ncbi:MAG: protein phosphatase 2C domain-containing protein [Syntrophobacteraceae bacterium]|nr:protein phosphatase 2C domain-containing protein [Syntrophobacteraceae bacterium]